MSPVLAHKLPNQTDLVLNGTTLELQDGSKVNAKEYLEGKVDELYFSASWCPPCRAFTPKLKEFYEKIKQDHPNFEVVFVSRGGNEESLVEYLKDHMGAWAYIPFGDEKIK